MKIILHEIFIGVNNKFQKDGIFYFSISKVFFIH